MMLQNFLGMMLATICLLGGCSTDAEVLEVDTENVLVKSEEVLEVSREDFIDSQYLGDYVIADVATGTEVKVVLENGNRVMTSNALPNHSTGSFPNSGNPNKISEQNDRYEFTLNPIYSGVSKDARTPGVALNGVKFEPGTAEVAYCDSGVSYRIEALQDVTDLGLDFNNAHVQPSGAYHYHGVSEMLVSAFDSEEDIVHVGFASDGHLMVYSKAGAFDTSYILDGSERTGVNCNYTTPGGNSVVKVDESSPAGTFTSDWEYVEGVGELDECNGTFLGDEYVYFITNEFPYVPRCLKGEFEEELPGGSSGAVPGGPGGRLPRR